MKMFAASSPTARDAPQPRGYRLLGRIGPRLRDRGRIEDQAVNPYEQSKKPCSLVRLVRPLHPPLSVRSASFSSRRFRASARGVAQCRPSIDPPYLLRSQVCSRRARARDWVTAGSPVRRVLADRLVWLLPLPPCAVRLRGSAGTAVRVGCAAARASCSCRGPFARSVS